MRKLMQPRLATLELATTTKSAKIFAQPQLFPQLRLALVASKRLPTANSLQQLPAGRFAIHCLTSPSTLLVQTAPREMAALPLNGQIHLDLAAHQAQKVWLLAAQTLMCQVPNVPLRCCLRCEFLGKLGQHKVVPTWQVKSNQHL